MLAPLCRMTLTVVAALLISFVDGTFDDDGQNARPADAPSLLLAHEAYADEQGTDGPTIELIGQQVDGTDGMQFRAKVAAPGLTCAMKVTYDDGGSELLDEVVADPSGVCTSVFAVTPRSSTASLAGVELAVTGESGEVAGEATQAFIVK
jgi:hypothetical protein